MKLPAVGGSTQGYMKSAVGFLRGMGKHAALPHPAHALPGYFFSLERPGKRSQAAQPHMKGVIREAAPIANHVRAEIKSIVKPPWDRERLLGRDSHGSPSPWPRGIVGGYRLLPTITPGAIPSPALLGTKFNSAKENEGRMPRREAARLACAPSCAIASSLSHQAQQRLCPSPCLHRSDRDGVVLQSRAPASIACREGTPSRHPPASRKRALLHPLAPPKSFPVAQAREKRKKIGKSSPAAATPTTGTKPCRRRTEGWERAGGPGGTVTRRTLLSAPSADPGPAPLPCQAVAAPIISAISYS